MKLLRLAKEGFLTGLTFSVGAFIFTEHIGGVVICSGPSMLPTIKTHDVLLTDQLTPVYGKIKKGDVVIARSPANMTSICKRVVAESGDSVYYKGEKIKVPAGHVWLEGDNKGDSTDSRAWGPLPLPMVRRRCLLKIWPLQPNFDMSIKEPAEGVYASASLSEKY